MSVGSADLHEAINTLWDDQNIDVPFKALWPADDQDEFIVLNDEEAGADQPFPYCVMEMESPVISSRMTGYSTSEKRHIREIPVQFRVHAGAISGVTKSSKEIASDLIDAIMQRFGGHPTVEPKPLVLTNGCVLQTQYDKDYCVRTGDDEHQWVLAYNVTVDVPVMV